MMKNDVKQFSKTVLPWFRLVVLCRIQFKFGCIWWLYFNFNLHLTLSVALLLVLQGKSLEVLFHFIPFGFTLAEK